MLLKTKGFAASAVRTLATKSNKVEDVFIVSCARTPLGSIEGSLKEIPATELGSHAIKSCLSNAGGSLGPQDVEEVFMGCVLQSGAGQAPARQAALGAGLAVSTPCTTVNKVCASGLKAMSLAASELSLGHRTVMVAGGMESLSNSPFLLRRGALPYGGSSLTDSCNHDGLTDAYSGWHMGRCAEETATKMGIGRQEQDDYGLESYRRAGEAASSGLMDREVVPLLAGRRRDREVKTDEEVGRCVPSQFRSTRCYWGSTVGVGSSSKLADGAAATLLCNETGLKTHGLTPLARVLATGDAAVEPTMWPVAPAKGVKELLGRAGVGIGEVAKWEINEAFAVVVLANCRLLGIGTENVNVNGGAIALGHPFGMSGTRITNHLALSLEKGQLGVATLCNGGGGAGSILIEKL